MLTMKKNHASDSRGLTVVDAIEKVVVAVDENGDDYWFGLARVIVQLHEKERKAA